MGGINSVLNQAKSALSSAQVAMNTTAKNVSNINTEGYSRQRVDFETGDPENYGMHRVGGGVKVAGVTRSVNDFLSKRIGEESGNLGKLKGQADIMEQIETIFKEEGESGVTGMVSKFFNDLRTLSTQPDSVPLRAAVRESAQGIAGRVQNMVRGMDQIKNDIDRRIDGNISEVNENLNRIASLNKQIMALEARSPKTMANDERDARDMAIKKLSSIMDVQVIPIENGGLNISSGSMGPLVVGVDASQFTAGRTDEGPNPGALHIFRMSEYPGASPKDITDRVSGGSLGGYLAVRDQTLPELNSKVDSLAYNLANEINGVHRQAYSRNNRQGNDFFEQPDGIKDAARNFSLSTAVQSDLSNIATAERPNSSGDNRAILRMTDLQQAPIFEGGKANFVDVASGIIGKLGAQARSVYESRDTQQGLVSQLETFHKEVSGVSLDEEAMDMLKFQKAFDASAKMIQVADSMMDTVINLKRF